MENDHKAFGLALSSLVGQAPEPPRVVAPANTLDVNHLAVTPALGPDPHAAGFKMVGVSYRAELGSDGQLTRTGGLTFFA